MKIVSHNKTLQQGLSTRKEFKNCRAWHKS